MRSLKTITPCILFLCVGLSSAIAASRQHNTASKPSGAPQKQTASARTRVKSALFRTMHRQSRDANVISFENARQSKALQNASREKIRSFEHLNRRQQNVFVELLYNAFKTMTPQERQFFDLLYLQEKSDVDIMIEMRVSSGALLEHGMMIRQKLEQVKNHLELEHLPIPHYRVAFKDLFRPIG